MRLVARGMVLLLCCTSNVIADPHTFQGRRLDDALRILQHDGLRIVFTSETVTPDMRVAVEPRAANPRDQLDEILSPHGLRAEATGGVIVVIRDKTAHPAPPPDQAQPIAARHRQHAAPRETPATTFTDNVTVRSDNGDQPSRHVSATTLDRSDLNELATPLDADGLTSVQAMPRVSSVDDFRGDFSVRGSPYRQIGVVIDGVATPWLQHTVYGRTDLGSVSMLDGDSLDRVTLSAGAYPRTYGDALGA